MLLNPDFKSIFLHSTRVPCLILLKGTFSLFLTRRWFQALFLEPSELLDVPEDSTFQVLRDTGLKTQMVLYFHQLRLFKRLTRWRKCWTRKGNFKCGSWMRNFAMASICWLVTSILEEEYLYLFHVYQQGHWTICVVPCYIFTQHKKKCWHSNAKPLWACEQSMWVTHYGLSEPLICGCTYCHFVCWI